MNAIKVISCNILILSLLAATASARLGETVDEIEARYGKAQEVTNKDGGEQRSYDYEGYLVQVAFVDGKSAYELVFATKDKGKISNGETLAFARALSGRDDWMAASKDGDTVVWNAPGFKMLKCSSTNGPDYLGVYTLAYWNEFRTKKSPEEAASEKAILEKFGAPDSVAGADGDAPTKSAPRKHTAPATGYPPATPVVLTFTNSYGDVFDHVNVVKILPDGVLYFLNDGTGGGKIQYVDLPAEYKETLRYDAKMAKGEVKQ